MENYLTRKSEVILVEVWELKVYLLCPTDVTGVVDVLAKNACDREEHRGFVFVKSKEGHLVADVRHDAIMREKNGHGLPGAPRDRRVREQKK